MSTQNEYMLVLYGSTIDKERFFVKDDDSWTEDRSKGTRYENLQAVGKDFERIANAPNVEIQGMLHPAAVIKRGLDMGEATNTKAHGILHIVLVGYNVIDHAPISARIRPA